MSGSGGMKDVMVVDVVLLFSFFVFRVCVLCCRWRLTNYTPLI